MTETGTAAGAPLRARLRNALTHAMKSRDRPAIACLRGALGAIDNAESVDVSHAPPAAIDESAIAGGVSGLGAAEVPRREVTESEVRQIVRHEVSERRAAAADHEHAGQPARAAQLELEASILAELLEGRGPSGDA